MKHVIAMIALTVSVTASAQETNQTIGDWVLASEKDAMSDKTHFLVQAKGDIGDVGFLCDGNRKEASASILTNAFLGQTRYSRYNRDTRDVEYRVDDHPSVKQANWSYGTRSVHPNSEKEFARAIADGSTLKLRVMDYQFGSHMLTVPIKGAREAISRLYERCGVASPF